MIKYAAVIALSMLIVSQIISFITLLRKKSLPEMVVSLNLVGMATMAMILAFVFISDKTVYMDVALATILITFAGTVIIARYLKREKHDR